jgi:hypothetical protein
MTNWKRNLTGLIVPVSFLALIAFQVDIGESSKAISSIIRIYLIWGIIALFVGYIYENTAYKLPAFKTIKVLFMNESFVGAHINLKDKNNANLIFNDDIELEQKISIINSYDFQYIVVDKNMKSNNFLRSGIEGFSEIFNNNLFQILSRN